ncbi:hypothetical protein P9005_34420, partial [Bacillus cereus]|nr:hypothetical protein [Bacillus cereus]
LIRSCKRAAMTGPHTGQESWLQVIFRIMTSPVAFSRRAMVRQPHLAMSKAIKDNLSKKLIKKWNSTPIIIN